MISRLKDLIDLVVQRDCGLLKFLDSGLKLTRHTTDLNLLLGNSKHTVDLP